MYNYKINNIWYKVGEELILILTIIQKVIINSFR